MLDRGLLARPVLRHWRDDGVTEVTGEALWAEAASLAEWIATHTPPGALVPVIGTTSPRLMALFLGVALAGRLAAFLPPAAQRQDPDAFARQQRATFEAIDPAAIILADPELAETLRRLDPVRAGRVLAPPEGLPAGDAAAALATFRARLDDDRPLFVQHSSGTTGLRKGVAISGRMLAAQYAAYWPGLRADLGRDRLAIASWLPLYHDMGLLACFLLPMLGGDRVSVMDPVAWVQQPARFLTMIAQDRCEVAWMPNFAFRHHVRLARAMPPADLSSMRRWINCSEPCRLADALAFEAVFAARGVAPRSVVGCYAMAETVFAVSQGRPATRRGLLVPANLAPGAGVLAAGARLVETDVAPPEGWKLVMSSGTPLPGVVVRVLAGDTPLPDGAYGEIALQAPFLFALYRGATTPARDADGGFRTGDLGCLLDGEIFVFGRLKEIIIVNGRNLFAGDLEAALGDLPGLKRGRAVAFGIDSAATGTEELVLVAEAEDGAADPAALAALISRTIADRFLVQPRDVQVVPAPWLVKSSSGKISRDANRARYLEQFRGDPP